MAKPKLRLVYDEARQSYVFLEKSEASRVIKILKLLPELTGWTPAGKIASMIEERLPAVLSTLHKLAGAESLDLRMEGTTKVLARRPVLLLNKQEFNPSLARGKERYLRAVVYVRKD
jgi:DNA-binding transcriptional ArsR family regulator